MCVCVCVCACACVCVWYYQHTRIHCTSSPQDSIKRVDYVVVNIHSGGIIDGGMF